MESQSSSLTRRLPALLLACLAVVAGALSLGASPAAAVPGPNQTQVTLDPVLATGLKVAGVKLVPKGAATSGSAGLYFPVTNAGSVSDAFVGTVKHQGGFELQVGKGLRVGFRNLTVKTQKGDPVTGGLWAEPVLFGTALGFQIPISHIDVDSVALRSPGVVAKYRLVIDPLLVQLVNKVLNISLLKPGQPWATVETRIARTQATAPAVTR